MRIIILSSWSNPGGSTTSFINLTNALNEAGYETIFYGPHDFHLNKCNGRKHNNNTIDCTNKDILVVHFTNLQNRVLPAKRYILSSHEQNLFEIKKLNYKIYDKIHYVSEHQRLYHNVDHPYFIAPNIVDELNPSLNKPNKIAGIIGSIDRNKQTHISIERAIRDGMNEILIYGNITDKRYFLEFVNPLLQKYPQIIMKGYEENKQKMYDSISTIYHSSLMESWGYIKVEAEKTGTTFRGNSCSKEIQVLSKKEIVDVWVKELLE